MHPRMHPHAMHLRMFWHPRMFWPAQAIICAQCTEVEYSTVQYYTRPYFPALLVESWLLSNYELS